MEWACRVRLRGLHRVPASLSHPEGPSCAQGSGLTLQGTPPRHRALSQERGERTQGPQRPLRSMSPAGVGRGTYYRGCGVRGAAGGPGPRGVSRIVVGARGETDGLLVRGASRLRDQRLPRVDALEAQGQAPAYSVSRVDPGLGSRVQGLKENLGPQEEEGEGGGEERLQHVASVRVTASQVLPQRAAVICTGDWPVGKKYSNALGTIRHGSKLM